MIRKNKAIRSIISFSLSLALLLSSSLTVKAEHDDKDTASTYTADEALANDNDSTKSDSSADNADTKKKSSAKKTIFVPDEPTTKKISDIQDWPDADDGASIEKTAIVMTNDTHGSLDGFAYLPALESLLKQKGYEVILVDCGDYSSGSHSVESSDGISALKIMSGCGYDVGILGNHEFDFDYKDDERIFIRDRLKLADYPILSANVTDKASGQAVADHNYVYISKDTNMKIGFFGLDTGETSDDGHRSTDEGQGKLLNVLIGEDLVNRAQLEIDDLKNTNGTEIDDEPNPTADFVVCLAHLGVDDERQGIDSSVDVYAGTNGIDLLLDANSHDAMTSGPDGSPIVSTGSRFDNIGVILLDNNKDEKTNEFHPTITNRFLIEKENYKANLDRDEAIKKLINQARNSEFDYLAKEVNPNRKEYVDEDDDEDNKDDKNTEDVNTPTEQPVVEETEKTPTEQPAADKTDEPQPTEPQVDNTSDNEKTLDTPTVEVDTPSPVTDNTQPASEKKIIRGGSRNRFGY